MKNLITLLIIILFTTVSIAQNGINYKAIVKDGSGNLVANDLIQVNFKILQGVAQTEIYEETHSQSTDANGIIILNIGEGTIVTGNFATIDWASDDTFLNVQINTGAGLVDLGTTAFKTVPYAMHAVTAETATNVSGLEAIDEGNGIGWRLKGRDLNDYQNIGLNALDLAYSQGYGNGATGETSVAMGSDTTASGNTSTAMGASTSASGDYTTATGLQSIASGDFSTAMGSRSIARSYVETAMGNFTTDYTPNSTSSWNANDRLFVIGNGTSFANRSDAFTILKNGNTTINGSTEINGFTQINGGRLNINSNHGFNGISVNSAGYNGIEVFLAENHGGDFTGDESGVYAESSNNSNPDIILGGTANTTTGDDGIISSDSSYAGSDIFLRSNDAVVVQLDFDNNESGNFEIKNSTNTEVFDVSEAGNVVIAGSLTQNSDRRLKKDITDLSYGLNEILQLQPKTYHWKNRTEAHKSLGLIAQEVQPIIKEIVNTSGNEEKTLGISYIELIPILINAIKEQNKRIDALEARLDSQQNTELVSKD